jgi:hypothetical protein
VRLAGLDQVQRSFPSAASRTVFADSGHNQAMSRDAKIMLMRHGITNLLEFDTAKFNQFIALLTMQVVVLRITVVVFVDSSPSQGHLSQ